MDVLKNIHDLKKAKRHIPDDLNLHYDDGKSVHTINVNEMIQTAVDTIEHINKSTVKNCVVRTWRKEYINPTEKLSDKLDDGWIVKSIIPFVGPGGKTEFIEYILEKEIVYEGESGDSSI